MKRSLIFATILSVSLFGSAFGAGKGSSGGSKGTGAKGTGSKPAATTVKGYTKKDGTHVDGHKRTTPDGTQKNNFSAKGNTNPNTGKTGTKSPKK